MGLLWGLDMLLKLSVLSQKPNEGQLYHRKIEHIGEEGGEVGHLPSHTLTHTSFDPIWGRDSLNHLRDEGTREAAKRGNQRSEIEREDRSSRTERPPPKGRTGFKSSDWEPRQRWIVGWSLGCVIARGGTHAT